MYDILLRNDIIETQTKLIWMKPIHEDATRKNSAMISVHEDYTHKLKLHNET